MDVATLMTVFSLGTFEGCFIFHFTSLPLQGHSAHLASHVHKSCCKFFSLSTCLPTYQFVCLQVSVSFRLDSCLLLVCVFLTAYFYDCLFLFIHMSNMPFSVYLAFCLSLCLSACLPLSLSLSLSSCPSACQSS